MTRLVHFDIGESLQAVTASTLEKVFASGKEGQTLDALGRFSLPYGHRVRAILLPEIAPTSVSDNTRIWTIPYHEDGRVTVATLNLARLKKMIQNESGGPVHVGAKGLTYGTSTIECVLSKTDSSYPGDADAVIVDKEGKVRCVVEYKKHTLSSALGDHLVDRYYPRPDGRKYQRLYALVSYYRQWTPDIPFVVLYYSTKSSVIRLQQIGELGATAVTIDRDSGDWATNGMSDYHVAKKIMDWLQITR